MSAAAAVPAGRAVHAELAAWQMSARCSNSAQLESQRCLRNCQLGQTCDAAASVLPLRDPRGGFPPVCAGFQPGAHLPAGGQAGALHVPALF